MLRQTDSAPVSHNQEKAMPLSIQRRLLLGGAMSVLAHPASASDRASLNRRVFEAVWQRVHKAYYDTSFHGINWIAIKPKFASRAEKARTEVELYFVLNEMLGQLRDAHAIATSPSRLQELERRRRHAVATGAGFDVRFADRKGVVTTVHAGSPAERAGIKRGWVLVSINGEPFGPGVQSPDLPFDALFLTQLDTVTSLRIESGIYTRAPVRDVMAIEGAHYVRFDAFEDPDIDWATQTISQIQSGKAIIDLRDNVGGKIAQFERFAGVFFNHPVTYATFVKRTGRSQSLRFNGKGTYSGEIAVLADRGTNSAAEIFAAVVQDQGRGKIIGEKTAGNVLGATHSSLPDGGRMTLSVHDLVLTSGQRLEGRGVLPDISAPRTFNDFRSGLDPAMVAALNAFSSSPEP